MEPGMCVKGCGFFGSAENRNMCSRCYTDTLKSMMAVHSAALDQNSDRTPPPTENDGVSGLTADAEGSRVTSSEKKRCDKCKKKAGVTGYECRCGGLFCENHRLPEQHDCGFDFKSQNYNPSHLPLIKGDKLARRI